MTNEEAIAYFKRHIDLYCVTGICREAEEMAIQALEQEPKTGHWKRISIDKYSEHAQYWYRCTSCGKDHLGNTNFCPDCGARMSENPTGSDVIWYDKRNYSEIVIEPRESEG